MDKNMEVLEPEKDGAAKTIVLDHPVKFGSETIKVLYLQQPRGAHMKKLSMPPTIPQLIDMASKLSGVSGAVFDDMHSKDVTKVLEAVGELL